MCVAHHSARPCGGIALIVSLLSVDTLIVLALFVRKDDFQLIGISTTQLRIPKGKNSCMPSTGILVYTHARAHTHTHTHTHTHVFMCFMTRTRACVHMCACACVLTHTHTHRERDKHTHTHECTSSAEIWVCAGPNATGTRTHPCIQISTQNVHTWLGSTQVQAVHTEDRRVCVCESVCMFVWDKHLHIVSACRACVCRSAVEQYVLFKTLDRVHVCVCVCVCGINTHHNQCIESTGQQNIQVAGLVRVQSPFE